jgi:hypothetical protein
MYKKLIYFIRRKLLPVFFTGFVVGLLVTINTNKMFESTSTNKSCEICHFSRDFTRTEEWLRTDPHMPQTIWWLSECNSIGFRVVCEFDENTGKYNYKQFI